MYGCNFERKKEMALTVNIKPDHWEIKDDEDIRTYIVRKDDVSMEYDEDFDVFLNTIVVIKGTDFKEWSTQLEYLVVDGIEDYNDRLNRLKTVGFTKGLTGNFADRIGGAAPVSYVVTGNTPFTVDTTNAIELEFKNLEETSYLQVDGLSPFIKLNNSGNYGDTYKWERKFDATIGKYAPMPVIVVGPNGLMDKVLVTHHFPQI